MGSLGEGYEQQGASLVAQLVKNLPAMLETWFDPCLERSSKEGNSYPLHCSCLENSMDRGACRYSPRGHKESDMTERLSLHQQQNAEVLSCGSSF